MDRPEKNGVKVQNPRLLESTPQREGRAERTTVVGKVEGGAEKRAVLIVEDWEKEFFGRRDEEGQGTQAEVGIPVNAVRGSPGEDGGDGGGVFCMPVPHEHWSIRAHRFGEPGCLIAANL